MRLDGIMTDVGRGRRTLQKGNCNKEEEEKQWVFVCVRGGGLA